MSSEVITLLLCLAGGLFTIVGGVGGGLYMAYFVCAGVLVIMLVYFFNAFYPATDGLVHPTWGFAYNDKYIIDRVCEIIQCGRTIPYAENLDNSLLTFSSFMAFVFAFCCGISTFSYSHTFTL